MEHGREPLQGTRPTSEHPNTEHVLWNNDIVRDCVVEHERRPSKRPSAIELHFIQFHDWIL